MTNACGLKSCTHCHLVRVRPPPCARTPALIVTDRRRALCLWPSLTGLRDGQRSVRRLDDHHLTDAAKPSPLLHASDTGEPNHTDAVNGDIYVEWHMWIKACKNVTFPETRRSNIHGAKFVQNRAMYNFLFATHYI